MRHQLTNIPDLIHSPELVLLIDLDGTLIPFADCAENARLDSEAVALLRGIMATDVRVAVVSGRPRCLVDFLRPLVPGAWWMAEHGVWRSDTHGWHCAGERNPELDQLGERLTSLARAVPGARVEWKSLSVCLHWRQVRVEDRPALQRQTECVIADWLGNHHEHRRLSGAEMVEVGPRRPNKGDAIPWVRRASSTARLLAIGDDLTDEDMFAALGANDLGVAVGSHDRLTRAGARLGDVSEVRAFLRRAIDARSTIAEAKTAAAFICSRKSIGPRS